MQSIFARARRAIWTYRQPLSRIPRVPSAPISDLFVWRKGADWQTWFELTDVAGLFETKNTSFNEISVKVLLFDAKGREFGQHVFRAPKFKRLQINISELADRCVDDIGTFCVLHPATPISVGQLGSHLVERGYLSYQYKSASLRAYVHGNLDAVSLGLDGQLERLSGSGFLQREYRLQHDLLGPAVYEIALVNASDRQQKIRCDVVALSQGVQRKKIETLAASLAPGGCHVFRITPGKEAQRIVIKSHLVMARPLIFRIENQTMDVLHG